jgi:phosphatidylserine/phosphatidylglycerophosphate/cardiolipin synthase-like enzyme
MVTDIAKQFVENWDYQRKIGATSINMDHYLTAIKHLLNVEKNQGIRGNEHYNTILKDKDRRMFGVCRFIKQAPYVDRHSIGKAYLKLLDKTQSYLAISDPVKTDTIVTSRFNLPLTDKLDNFEMYNRLHEKVQGLARKGKKIDYITTNINMAGNENVAIMNERIRGQLESGKEVWASWSLAKLHASNVYFGRPHYKNLLNDWVPFKNVHVWTHMSFIHSKIFYFDRIVASVGSYNFQHNATDHAYESTAICMDENLNRKLDVIMVEDMANSIPLIYSAIR